MNLSAAGTCGMPCTDVSAAARQGFSWRLDEPGQCLRPPLAERLSVQREVILALAHLSSEFEDGRPRASGVDLVRRGADRFGLDDADGVLVDVEQVVRPAVALCHDDLTDRDPRAGDEVQALPVLHHPAGIVELPVNQDAGRDCSAASWLSSLTTAHP